MTEKKASEILVELVEKVDFLTQMCQNMDFNIKTLLTQINLQNKVKQEPVVITAAAPKVEASTDNKKTVIEQAILYKTNQRPVILASVEIFDLQTGSLVAKQVTGSNGKWKTSLPAGTYKVEVKKGPVETNKAFIERFEISVSNNGTPLILENKLV